MKGIVRWLHSLLAAMLTTLIILVGSFLMMLFSSADDGYRTSYFGSIFFSSTPTPDNIIRMEFGVANLYPILFTIAILFAIYLVIFTKWKKDKSS